MARAICVNGHYYDDEKFKECPHCAAGLPPIHPGAFTVSGKTTRQEEEVIGEETAKGKTGSKKRLFGFGKENPGAGKREKDERNQNRGSKRKRQDSIAVTENRTQALPGGMYGTPEQGVVGDEGVTQGFSKADKETEGHSIQHENFVPDMDTYSGSVQNVTQKMGDFFSPRGSNRAPGSEEEKTGNADRDIRQEVSLKGKVNTEADQDAERRLKETTQTNIVTEGVVAGYNGRNIYGEAAKNEGKTIGYFSTGAGTEPPVGYLICIEGEDYGIGFLLKSGNNSIGRSSSMDVVIMDVKVSREKQAFVMYEPHKREFYLKPGDGVGLCYLNDELVMEPKKLQAHDIILLGDTKLMLIPVCGEKFSW